MKKPDLAFQKSLKIVFNYALKFLGGLINKLVGAEVDLSALRQRLNRALTDEGVPPEQVIREFSDDVEGGLLESAGGRLFAWVNRRLAAGSPGGGLAYRYVG